MSSTNTSTNDLQYNSGDFAPVPADNGDNEIASTAHLLPGPDLSNAATITSGADSFWSSFQTLPLPDHSYGDTLGPSLFDSILNPAGLNHGRYSPFAYNPLTLDHAFPTPDTMPASTRLQAESSQRPARLPNGYVDLTASPDSPPRRRKPSASSPGPSNKRRKREDGTAAEQEIEAPPEVEEVDLTQEVDPIQEILQKQRADAIKAQEKPEETRTTFNTFNCVICMDNPTDLTATACGHLFCHTCLMEALIAGENRTGPGETKRSQCPVCRKVINRNKASDIIPLLLKKGLATQPRKKVAVPHNPVQTEV